MQEQGTLVAIEDGEIAFMIEISESGRRLTSSDLNQIEGMVGAKLSKAYRDFLQAHNGGVPWPNSIDVSGLPGSPTDVQVIFGVELDEPTSNLDWNYSVFNESSAVKKRFLPVACDSGGGVFCLKIMNSGVNEVVYFEECSSDGPEYLVADDFLSFLAALREI